MDGVKVVYDIQCSVGYKSRASAKNNVQNYNWVERCDKQFLKKNL